MLKKIITGGQTGVDRAALDAALENNFPCGGWCPRGRWAEDGRIAPKYPLKETELPEYEARTKLNVIDSDGTLIVTKSEPTGGTALTIEFCRIYEKPYFIVDIENKNTDVIQDILHWIDKNHIQILNIAGPRESKFPGIYKTTKALIQELLRRN